MNEVGGYMGSLLRVDLGSGKRSHVRFEEAELRRYIGGSGLGARILFDETTSKTDPLGPENVLAFLTGPLTGTRAITSGRHAVVSRSPLTGLWGESDSGGTWGATLKRAGLDGVILNGASDNPVYLVIRNGEAEIRDARHLWGLTTSQADAAIKDEVGVGAVVATIGPAGEKLSRIAAIMHDGKHARAAGRGGLGAVMGSKNVKAIAVLGDQKVPVADPEGLASSVKRLAPAILKKVLSYRDFGTAGAVLPSAMSGDLPAKNWTVGSWLEGAEKISGQRMTDTILTGRYGCDACVIRCGRVVKVDSGPYAGVEGAGPEYEAMAGFGSMCMVDDLEAVAMANQMANEFGIDVISAGNCVAFALEAFERGIITSEDTGGVELSWGDPQSVFAVIRQIAMREGIGELLADGVKAAAKQLGPQAEEFALEVKGMEPAFHDPRATSSLAVGYATHPRGACHRGGTQLMERTPVPELGFSSALDRFASEGKGALAALLHDYYGLFNSLKLCQFIIPATAPTDVVGWIRSATGWDMDLDELLQAGEMHTNLKRLYNLRCGLSAADDRLPPRLLKEALESGGAAGRLPQLDIMLTDYYRARDWVATGMPSQDKLNQLGLVDEGARTEKEVAMQRS